VVSGSRGPGQRFDFNLSVGWTHEQKTAYIKREREGQATSGVIALDKELVYRQRRDVLNLRADFGVIRDLSLFAVTPLVLADVRSLDFDRTGACAGGSTAGCVDENNATILRDGILPRPGPMGYGIDAQHGRRFAAGSDGVFRGATRKGLESLGLGASLALFNQERDDTGPTWIVRFESRLAVSSDMRFDPADPKANTAVGPGYHQFVLSTIFSRRFSSMEPYLGMWYIEPVAKGDSVFKRFTLGSGAFTGPQRRAGAEIGLEAVAWQDARARQRINVELRGRMELRLFGLAQSEIWEPLSGSTRCPATAGACRTDVDRDLTGDRIVDANPGVVRSPTYGLYGGDAGLSVQVGRTVRFRGLGGVTFEQARFLTDTRSRAQVYDVPGRRFRVEDSRSWRIFLDGGLMF